MIAAAASTNSGEVGNALTMMFDGFTPFDQPSRTYLPADNIPTDGGAGPTDSMVRALTSAVNTQGAAGTTAWDGDIMANFGPLLNGQPMAFIDTSDVTTAEALNDVPLQNPIMATRWEDDAQLAFSEFMPLFAFKSDLRYTAPGFSVLATPAKINALQARLVQLERDALLGGVRRPADDPRRVRMRVDDEMRGRWGRTYATTALSTAVDANELTEARQWASQTPAGLFAKLEFLGPCTSVWSGDGPKPSITNYDVRRGETLLTHGWGTRAYIHNMFSLKPVLGEQFYFEISKYSQESLSAIGAASGWSSQSAGFDRKRAYDNAASSWVTMPAHTADGDAFVQVRGWSSRDGQQWLGKTSPLETMKPDVADRFYVEREKRAAVEYRQFEFDDATGDFKLRDLAKTEGLQEAVANLPDIVLENYLSSGYIFPVGNVKGVVQVETTPTALLNAHYSDAALVNQPVVEIYLNF